MGVTVRKICAQPGCHATSTERYCPAHARQAKPYARVDDRARGSSHARGYDATWRKARAHYLAEHPLCVRCAERQRTTAASVVDHVVPHRGDMALFWNQSNWAALCTRCHNAKTATGR
jgi:5-methylcytosine-specific restriction enzyme A